MGTNSNTIMRSGGNDRKNRGNLSPRMRSPKSSAHVRQGGRSPAKKSHTSKKHAKHGGTNRTSPIHIRGGEIKTCPDDLEDYLFQLEQKQEDDWSQFYSIEASKIDTKKEDKVLKETAIATAEHAEDNASLDKTIADSRLKWQEHRKKITKFSDELCKVQDQIYQLEHDIDLIRGLDSSVITQDDLKKKESLEKKMRALQDKQSSVSVQASKPFDPNLKSSSSGKGGCSIM